jgi:hypothetical protein
MMSCSTFFQQSTTPVFSPQRVKTQSHPASLLTVPLPPPSFSQDLKKEVEALKKSMQVLLATAAAGAGAGGEGAAVGGAGSDGGEKYEEAVAQLQDSQSQLRSLLV